MYKMYAIPNCDTVKKARSFLDKKKISYEFIDFKKNPPKKEDILRWEDFFKDLPINKSGLTYKKHKEEFEKLSPSAKITFIISQTSMIKRPVLEKNGKVLALGFDEENYAKILKNG